MKNYRVTFLHNINCDYWGKDVAKLSFRQVYERYYPWVADIRTKAQSLGIKYIWCFFEPYIEITWFGNKKESEKLFKHIEKLCEENNIKDLKKLYPIDGDFCEWYHCNDEEYKFGAKRYAICSDLVALFDEYNDSIQKGKGVKKQVSRTIHAVCNQLGLNYKDEASICLWRGLACWLITYIGYNRAMWVMKNIFRQK